MKLEQNLTDRIINFKKMTNKTEISQNCPYLRFEELEGDNGIHYCDGGGFGAHTIDTGNNRVFEIRNKKYFVVSCPKGFEVDETNETNVPCFCAAPQAREYQEAQKPLNRLKKIFYGTKQRN
jgi:hypothetical protein